MAMTRISTGLLITSTFLCGTQLFCGQDFTEPNKLRHSCADNFK